MGQVLQCNIPTNIAEISVSTGDSYVLKTDLFTGLTGSIPPTPTHTALKATPQSPTGDVSYGIALEQTVRSGAHGFRFRRPRSLLTVLSFCRIKVRTYDLLYQITRQL